MYIGILTLWKTVFVSDVGCCSIIWMLIFFQFKMKSNTIQNVSIQKYYLCKIVFHYRLMLFQLLICRECFSITDSISVKTVFISYYIFFFFIPSFPFGSDRQTDTHCIDYDYKYCAFRVFRKTLN